MAKRWVIGGLAVGVGALALVPDARTWLRRRLGLEPEDRRWFEEEEADLAEHEGDEPLDTRESRFSLRARLAEEGHAEQAPEEPSFPAFESATAAPSFPAFDEPAAESAPAEPETPATEEPAPVEQPAADEPAAPAAAPAPFEPPPPVEEPAAEEPVEEPAAEEPVEEPAAEEPAAPAPAPFEPPVPAPAPEYVSYEALPAVTPEADAPKTPGEDTNEIEPLPAEDDPEPPAAEAPLPPPTLLRPPAPPRPSRPFTGEGASFRSAIDAARERVHGAAREATPDEGDGTEPIEERS